VFPVDCTSGFDMNVYLKHNLKPVLDDDDNLKHHCWVIQSWGGIDTFNLTENNIRILRNLRAQLATQKLTSSESNVIASVSKVASFYDPANFSIYDSRAIYTLNWLLAKHCPEMELFPQPSGRGKAASLDLYILLELAGNKKRPMRKPKAYFKYCELVKQLAEEVYGDSEKPYLLEMLLFMNTEKIQREVFDSINVAFPLLNES